MTKTDCDVCGGPIYADILEVGEVRFDVWRYDHAGLFDNLDVCSPTCLASLSISTAKATTEAQMLVTMAAETKPEPAKRKWWNR